MFDVACVGILCADVLGKPVNGLPERGKLQLVDNLQLQVGGCAANMSIDLLRIGLHAAIIGKIGDDGFGRFLSNVMTEEKVDVSGLKIGNSLQTSASMVMIDSEGERSIIHCLGSNAKFTYDDIDFEIVKNSKMLFIAGTFLMPGFDGKGAEKLLARAHQEGILCCMDTAWDSTGQWMSRIEGSLRYLDWFMPSYDEAYMLTGNKNPEDMADVFISKGARNVVIKLGKDGCFVKPHAEKGFTVPTYGGVKVVDTSGAGDSFCAGFAAGLTKGWDVRSCAGFANAVGTLCVMSIGTTSGVRSMTETLGFMESHRQ